MGRKDIEPQRGENQGYSAGDPDGLPPVDSSWTAPISRRQSFWPIAGMAVGGVSLLASGGLAWNLLNSQGGRPDQPASSDTLLPADRLTDKGDLLIERDSKLALLESKEGMRKKATFDISGITFTILSHEDKIVEIQQSGIEASIDALFDAAEAQPPDVYGDTLLKARSFMKDGKFVGKGLEVVLAYSGSADTYPSPRGTSNEEYSPFAPIKEGESFSDLADREPTQGIMESPLVAIYGLNAGAIGGKVERRLAGKTYRNLTPEQALAASTAHEVGHALLRFMGVFRTQEREEPYMRDEIESKVLDQILRAPQPTPVRYL